jgi:hypothetical protein
MPRPSRLRQYEIKQVILGARGAGARRVEFQLGEAVVIVPLSVEDDEKSTADAGIKAEERTTEKRISAA